MKGREDSPPATRCTIGFAIAPTDVRTVHALVGAKKNALLKSDNGGFRFTSANSADDVAPRPFYSCDIRVDPQDKNRSTICT